MCHGIIMKTWLPIHLLVLSMGVLLATSAQRAGATETENLGIRILPAPGAVNIDGRFADDWDLSGGVFACGDVENQRSYYAVWLHAMYDSQNLYLLARWIDREPMNNPGSIKGSNGFNGDCLQFRVMTDPDTPEQRVSHWTCWRDHDGLDAMQITYGLKFDEGDVNAKAHDARQAFMLDADNKGYVQEMAIPWALLLKNGVKPPAAGQRLIITFEPNFSIPSGGRLTIKDVFRAGVSIDRVFTFNTSRCWGWGTLEAKRPVAPDPVRLADGRLFPVHMESGIPVVDWIGLIRTDAPKGFKSIPFTMPADGYVSLNLYAPDGTVARQLLTAAFYTKGKHEAMWDGLTTPSAGQPGSPVAPGEYRWAGIYHTGIGLRLRGWACSGSAAPWEGWGGDHGNPVAAAADANGVYLGWDGGEAGKPLVACDENGKVRWRNIRGGIASASLLAADGKTVYVYNREGQYAAVAIYRVDARTGRYTEWSDLKSTDLPIKRLLPDVEGKTPGPSGLAAAGGRVFVSFSSLNRIVVVDAATGAICKTLTIAKPTDMESPDGKLLYVISEAMQVMCVDIDSGKSFTAVRPNLPDKGWLSALALDRDRNIYVGVGDTDNRVLVFAPDGRLIRAIGRQGGRALLGPWQADGMLNIAGLAVDQAGNLWVAEADGSPRRISVWSTASGELEREYFGASTYGAVGATANPVDPYLFVGQNCEWRIDPQTGRSRCVGVIERDGMANSRFGFSPDHKHLYLAISPQFIDGDKPVRIYERMGDGEYRLRTMIRRAGPKAVTVWADRNGDQREQDDEVHTYPIQLSGWITGWYMPMTSDLTFYGTDYQVAVTGWTACGAPEFDFTQARKIAGPADLKKRGGMGAERGYGSADNRLMLYNGEYGVDRTTFDCYDIASGKLLWTYPNNFTGVHGSHKAPGPKLGMIRGAYDIMATAKLSAPVGDVWVIGTNKGEWHILTERGFYLTHLFQSDPMQWQWPQQAAPGAVLDDIPPGAGEEAFGGSVTQADDGKLYVQFGHNSFYSAQIVGLDSIADLGGGKVDVTTADVELASAFQKQYLQKPAGIQMLTIKRLTPRFSGDIDHDFSGADIVAYKKQDDAAVRSALGWDDKNLYAAWQVSDDTPWINGADAPEFLYARGDTVDLQLATDPTVPADREEAQHGDLRLSIGSFQGKPTAVVYRRIADDKHPMLFNSGVVRAYQMQSVIVLKDVTIKVATDPAKRQYTVEAAIPLSAIGLHPAADMKIRGDIGVTHSNKQGTDTVLRTYWNNQNTGIVSDEVFELRMEPRGWGEMIFKN